MANFISHAIHVCECRTSATNRVDSRGSQARCNGFLIECGSLRTRFDRDATALVAWCDTSRNTSSVDDGRQGTVDGKAAAACRISCRFCRARGGGLFDDALMFGHSLCPCLLYTSPSPRDRQKS